MQSMLGIDFRGAFGGLRHIWHGGPVGKKAAVAVCAIFSVAVIAIAVGFEFRTDWALVLIAGTVGVIFLIFISSNASIDVTLQNHPQLAVLDQAGVLEFRRIELAAKGCPSPPDASDLISDRFLRPTEKS